MALVLGRELRSRFLRNLNNLLSPKKSYAFLLRSSMPPHAKRVNQAKLQ